LLLRKSIQPVTHLTNILEIISFQSLLGEGASVHSTVGPYPSLTGSLKV